LTAPFHYDIWFITHLSSFLGRHPLFDMSVQSAVGHNLLGGFWYAAALFYFWVSGAGRGGQATRTRVLAILLGSSVAIVLAALAGHLVSWLPPARLPELAHLYPEYLFGNPNTNSFPSYSVALYTATAAGVYTLSRRLGWLLLAAVPAMVALPRMYLGGHYASDVLAGAAFGVIGFAVGRALERPLASRIESVFEQEAWTRAAGEVIIFAWLWQVAVEFREVAFVVHSIPYFLP